MQHRRPALFLMASNEFKGQLEPEFHRHVIQHSTFMKETSITADALMQKTALF